MTTQKQAPQAEKPKPQPQPQLSTRPQAKPATQNPQEKEETPEEKELEIAREIEEEVREQIERQKAEEAGIEFAAPQPPTAQKPSKVALTTISLVAGLIILFDAAAFGFFTFSQYGLLFSYMQKVGFFGFLNSANYAYGMSFLNFIMLLALAVSGVLMLLRLGRVYIASGSVAIAMLIVSSFEYLNTNATYFVVIAVITLFSILAVVYSRISAVELAEEMSSEQEEIVWPRIETF
jgi:hypothetical protein